MLSSGSDDERSVERTTRTEDRRDVPVAWERDMERPADSEVGVLCSSTGRPLSPVWAAVASDSVLTPAADDGGGVGAERETVVAMVRAPMKRAG
jgi:hypothetical protein